MPQYISKTFTHPVWDEWMKDSFTEGKTGTYTYSGPEFLTFEVGSDPADADNYGKESGWCMWEHRDLERPCAPDITRITVDCKENPLLCEIANDCGSEDDNAFRRARTWYILWDAPTGYTDVEATTQILPRDIWDEHNITYDFNTKKFNMPVRTWANTGSKMDMTWDEIREIRDQLLNDTDAKVGGDDMPADMTQMWKDYRTRLRDLPSTLQALNYEPWQAAMMFPNYPKDMKDPVASHSPDDIYAPMSANTTIDTTAADAQAELRERTGKIKEV